MREIGITFPRLFLQSSSCISAQVSPAHGLFITRRPYHTIMSPHWESSSSSAPLVSLIFIDKNKMRIKFMQLITNSEPALSLTHSFVLPYIIMRYEKAMI